MTVLPLYRYIPEGLCPPQVTVLPLYRYMPEGLCLEGSLAEKGKVEGFPLGLGKNIKFVTLCDVIIFAFKFQFTPRQLAAGTIPVRTVK